ncbi:MAG: DUF2059 domain-containing protein [Sphingomonas sp.]|uniref:DUF2059 domain-containing protein n=1 Tax=Sphingomonas sp. TaxID=28214 RepID=UPI00120147BD|nr:DUF2059 domain-containing protein [Sphingomonas sp.]THD37510.1 MAG: DUF2059 domain-containing protein [Sphingomonas sp.]
MKTILTAVAMAVAAPAWAQTAPTMPQVAANPGPVDPARLAAAKPVIDQVWPLGTYERIMHVVMDQMVNASMASMYDMKVDDFAKGMGADDKALGGKTFRDVMGKEDPYFEERMRRSMKVMTDEMIALMNEVEPDVRVAFANAYARRFTVAQLNDLHAFFDTPTGRIYAAESMTLMMGPDMMKAMQAFTPKFMERMPAIMAKVEAATKDLPAPPKRKPGKP